MWKKYRFGTLINKKQIIIKAKKLVIFWNLKKRQRNGSKIDIIWDVVSFNYHST